MWRDAAGRIRSGWVVAAFTAVAAAAALALHGAIHLAGLEPRWPYALDDPRLVFGSVVNLISGAAATAVALKLGQEAGFARPRLAAWGFVAGAALVSASVGLGALVAGGVAISACGARALFGLQQLVTVGPTALGEELWMRGAALRALARGTHPVFAVAGTGIVFGALHLTNPDATWVAALNVALVGIWFGAMAWRTQSIWPSVGAHLAWNWFEGFFWGQPVSGIQPGCSLLTASAQPPFWAGGPFGPEASGFTAVLLAVASAVTVLWPRRVRDPESPPAP